MTSGTLSTSTSAPAKENPAAEQNVLETEEIVKIYGGRAVVNGININVRAGEIVGLARSERRRENHQFLHDRRTR